MGLCVYSPLRLSFFHFIYVKKLLGNVLHSFMTPLIPIKMAFFSFISIKRSYPIDSSLTPTIIVGSVANNHSLHRFTFSLTFHTFTFCWIGHFSSSISFFIYKLIHLFIKKNFFFSIYLFIFTYFVVFYLCPLIIHI